MLGHLRTLAYTSPLCPMPALEMLICEMLAIHFCSDRGECIEVLAGMISEVEARVAEGVGVLGEEAVRVFWVNPVADLRVMNLLEICGGRLCGTEFLFSHALDEIPEDVDPMEALARAALADPMVGTCGERAERISRDLTRFGAEALVISRVPGASHCAFEGELIGREVAARCGVPVLEIEVPSLDDAVEPALRTRLEALVETARAARKRGARGKRT
jgi:benzoyl-CoA reductase/2-hydroxyglutaryl-CoA dehydratase subunit BcrC/BadD/HgdB